MWRFHCKHAAMIFDTSDIGHIGCEKKESFSLSGVITTLSGSALNKRKYPCWAYALFWYTRTNYWYSHRNSRRPSCVHLYFVGRRGPSLVRLELKWGLLVPKCDNNPSVADVSPFRYSRYGLAIEVSLWSLGVTGSYPLQSSPFDATDEGGNLDSISLRRAFYMTYMA